MEHDPFLSTSPRPSAEHSQPQEHKERGGFFDKFRKKVKPSPESESPKVESIDQTGDHEQRTKGVRSERRAFGQKILGIIYSAKSEGQPTQSQENTAVQELSGPEQTPQFERATRTRRFARVIIARVLREAASEPERARRNDESEPLETHTLVDAAHDLSDAADDLNQTAVEAQSVSQEQVSHQYAESFTDSSYDGFETPIRLEQSTFSFKNTAAERIDNRLRQLEVTAEDSRGASLAAVGLGVIAVIVTGAEYFSRKRSESQIRRDVSEAKRDVKQQNRAFERQQVVFDRLRETQAKNMGRNQRQDYYDRLSAFTYQQADRTREANRELRRVIEQVEPASVVTTAPEARRTHEQRAEPETEPLVRVESADTVERSPGQQTGNAGTGFFGGGGAGSHADVSAMYAVRKMADPDSPEARKLEELRRIEQARLQQNAWFYGAALIATMIGAVVAAVALG